MGFTVKESCVRTIKSGDPGFYIRDGVVIAPRAGFEISRSCPAEYKSIIAQAINAGWIKPVANLTEQELMWINLKE